MSRHHWLLLAGSAFAIAFVFFAGWLLVRLGVGPPEALDAANQLSGVASLFVGVVALVVAGVALIPAFRRPTRPPENMSEVAQELAGKIREQWTDESRARRVNHPYPLPVTWRNAPEELFTSRLPTTQADGEEDPAGRPTDETQRGASPEDRVTDRLVKTLREVPTGRLVVLGEPGAGKTILLVQLTLDLPRQRTDSAPVPVLLSVTSWNPKKEPLQNWLAGSLKVEYPWLTRTAPGTASDRTCLEALLQEGKILPLLDGLDEIPDKVRRSALDKINDWLQDGASIVVSCRSEEYGALVRQTDTALGRKLSGAAGVVLDPLDAEAVSDYLVEDCGDDEAARKRWKPVTDLLKKPGVLTSALETPLMASLTRTIYNPRENESTKKLPDPKTLVTIAEGGSPDRPTTSASISSTDS